MKMPPLRHPTPLGGVVRQHIPFDERDSSVELREHPSGKQPSHTCTTDNSSLTKLAHRHTLHYWRMWLAALCKNERLPIADAY
jgi:hypothetical protein